MTTQLTLPDPGTVAPLHSEPQIVVDWFWLVHGEDSHIRYESYEQAEAHRGWNATIEYVEVYEEDAPVPPPTR